MYSRRTLQDDEGAMIVEFGILVPILLFLVFGIVDFGRALYSLNNITTAVREGARYGAVRENPVADSALIRAQVERKLALYGGTTVDSVIVTPDLGARELTVAARITFRPITPLMRMIGRTNIPMRQQAVFRLEDWK
jgi:Flp pilus assembly protein TadG